MLGNLFRESGVVKQLAEGNMAVEYEADLTQGWGKTLNADSFRDVISENSQSLPPVISILT